MKQIDGNFINYRNRNHEKECKHKSWVASESVASRSARSLLQIVEPSPRCFDNLMCKVAWKSERKTLFKPRGALRRAKRTITKNKIVESYL